ncbi:MAG: 6-carboxytetrahydropterin synthase [Armatimonadetes bacterium]|nr:6-carboxytetrahydropterin synthase [Armatimonadota bacterium]
MTMYLRRRAQFSAGFLNAPAGGTGGGHNYTVELTVGGAIDPRSGMVVNITDVDAVLKAKVVRPLDGALLDRDVPAFRDTPPTPENVARFVWHQCGPAMPPASRLARVTLRPLPTLWTELTTLDPRLPTTKGDSPVLTVTRAYDFSASHRLHSLSLSDAENREIFGKCNWENGHGHNYEVEVTLAGAPDPKTGLLFAPETLDAAVDVEVLQPYDHRHLNYDAPEFRDLNPTSENLTRVIWDKLSRRLASADLGGARLYRVAVRETARNYFEYFGE